MNITLQTPARDLQKSKNFYKQLGFAITQTETGSYVTDGVSIVKLNANAYARAGINCYKENWKDIIVKLKKLTPVVETKDNFQFTDLSGTVIYLKKNALPTIHFQKEISKSVLGDNAGISIETPSIAASMNIWELLGFSLIQGSADSGWVTLQNTEGVNISLMALNTCPHLFHNPSLTFFNGKNNTDIIKKVRSLDIEIDEEVVVFNKKCKVDNIVLRDPGGIGFFVFND